MGKVVVVSAKIPEEVYNEFMLRIPEGERGEFIRSAIVEKLQTIPRPDKISELEQKINKLESSLFEIKRYLAELEILTYEKGKVNPHMFCIDEVDHKILDYLLHYKGATTTELGSYLKINRWLVLNRLRKMEDSSKKQLGKPIVAYYAGEKSGKKKAWWVNKEFVEE